MNGTQGGPSCSMEPEERSIAGGQLADGGTADCAGFFWLLLGESSRKGREADARTPDQMIVRGGTARGRPRDGKTSRAPGGAESQQAWWRGRRAGVAGAQPNDQLALGEHEGAIGTESGTLPGRRGSAVVDILLEGGSMKRAVGSGTTALPTRSTIHQRGGKLDGRCGAAAAAHMGGVSQEGGATGAGHTPHAFLRGSQEVARAGGRSQGQHEVLTCECGPGTQARRAAQAAGTAEAGSSNDDFVISLVDLIHYGAQFISLVDLIHYGAQLPFNHRVQCGDELLVSLSAAENFVGFRWLVLVHNMSGDMKLRKEVMKRALREEKARKEAQENGSPGGVQRRKHE